MEEIDGNLQLGMWVVILGALSWMVLIRSKQKGLRVPPGPRAWPIVGCLLSVPKLNPPELMFAKLAETYGELMLLCMGQRKVVVVSSARMAMEFLKTHDQEFANRPHTVVFEHISFNDTSLLPMSTTNPFFKPTRRMFAAEIVSPRKVVATADVRREQVLKMLRNVVQDSDAGRSINVTKTLASLAMNLTLCINFGRDYGDKVAVADEAEILVRIFEKFMTLFISRNYGDSFPAIRWLDVQGTEAGLKECEDQIRKSITALIEYKRREMSTWSAEEIQSGANERDIMSKLLSMEGEDRFSEEQLVSVAFTLLLAGTDTIYKVITEAIHEVVRHEHIYKRALDELEAVVGTARLVEESDIPKLPLIHNIIKETLRMHPPGPTLLPHRNFEACEVGGYHIPANCTVMINLHLIQRDPAFWDSPLEFSPDRFNEMKITVQGSDFHYFPFGYGKRQCPGINLAMTTVQYVLAQCLQCINWQIPPGVERRMNLSTVKVPRKKDDLVLDGKLRVDRRLLEVNAP